MLTEDKTISKIVKMTFGALHSSYDPLWLLDYKILLNK